MRCRSSEMHSRSLDRLSCKRLAVLNVRVFLIDTHSRWTGGDKEDTMFGDLVSLDKGEGDFEGEFFGGERSDSGFEAKRGGG